MTFYEEFQKMKQNVGARVWNNVKIQTLQWANPSGGSLFPIADRRTIFNPNVESLILSIHLETACSLNAASRSMWAGVGLVSDDDTAGTVTLTQATNIFIGHTYASGASGTLNGLLSNTSSIAYQWPLMPFTGSQRLCGFATGIGGGDNSFITAVAHIVYLPVRFN